MSIAISLIILLSLIEVYADDVGLCKEKCLLINEECDNNIIDCYKEYSSCTFNCENPAPYVEQPQESKEITLPEKEQPQEPPELSACKSQCIIDAKNCYGGPYDFDLNQECTTKANLCLAKCEDQFSSSTETSQSADYGDAPDPFYPSRKESNGARHVSSQYEWIGLGVSSEPDSKQINVDDYDDGIAIYKLHTLPPCTNTVLPIIVSVENRNNLNHPYGSDNLLYLNLLFDWDIDGHWAGAANCGVVAPEHAVVNYPIDVSQWPQGATTKTVIVPLATGQLTYESLWVRATLSYKETASINWDGTGQFLFGETEDYGLLVFTEHRREPEQPPSESGIESLIVEPISNQAKQEEVIPPQPNFLQQAAQALVRFIYNIFN